ncbi:MAG: DUF177 domain-containing protein [Bryobacterales bacterium]|nr:DUF177 domain-containing protein [Bryobacterales bacterium]
MFFSLQDLELRKIHFDVAFQPGEINLSDPELKQAGPLAAQGVAELLSHTLGEIRLKGHLRVAVESACDRCLDPASFPIDTDFDLFFRPLDTSPSGEEVEIDEGETEISFYDGDGIQLEDALREYVLLSLPMQRVCREDCKGICPVCAENRNVVACNCSVKLVDDRWEALGKL